MPGKKLEDRPSNFRGPYAGCWEWTGYKVPFGYGRVSFNGKLQSVHRLVWEAINGPIPEGLWVLHHCDNPPCFRPDHLFLGTPADNCRDALNKGRFKTARVGTDHGMSKLSDEEVLAIRKLYATGTFFQKDLAEMFDVSRALISMIVTGRNWKHI